VVPWPYQPDSAAPGPRGPVPDVTGLGMREAVRTLHRRGFRVTLKGWGWAEHTWPAAGDSASVGSTVTLFAGPARVRAGAPARRRPRR
jgi:PASTA domain-containing protein